MVKPETNTRVFDSLADKTRRDIILRLSKGELTVSEIAKAYHMSLPAISKHLRVLESSNMILNERRGRQHFIKLAPGALQDALHYLQSYEASLSSRLAALQDYMTGPPDAAPTHAAQEHDTQTLTLQQVIDAPLPEVWNAYIDPRAISTWWPPGSTAMTSCENDVKVGGIWRFAVRNDQGYEFVFSGIYSHITPYERLVYTDGIRDPAPGRPEAEVSILFTSLPDNKTQITKTTVATPDILQLNAAWLRTAQRNNI